MEKYPLFRRTHFKSDLVDLAAKARLRADADALDNRCLIVDADVGGLVRREDIGLGFLDARLGDGFSVHQECRLSALAGPAAVISEIKGDRCGTARQRFRCSNGVTRQTEEVVGVGRLAIHHE